MKKISKNAFTLAETLITVVILGIVAAILVPNLINRQVENANRTKVKKAMAAYENIMSTIIIENDFGANANEIDNWAKEENNTCSKAAAYFKISETANKNSKCQFKTSDGLWWDIGKNGKLTKAIVAFKKADLTSAKTMNEGTFDAFYFITFFDDNNTARIIDMGYANQTSNTPAIINNAKVLAFINNKNIYDYFNFCTDTKKSCIDKICNSNGVCTARYYDSKGNLVISRTSCNVNALNCTSSTI